MNVLVLGAAGLLGNTMYRALAERGDWTVCGTIRNEQARAHFRDGIARNLAMVDDLAEPAVLRRTFAAMRPDVVVNCLSLPKSTLREDNLRVVIAGLAILPQHIARECAHVGARLIHFSTDGVFSGARAGGNYSEDDAPDATDVYGIAKLLGEARDAHAISIRTSMVGHELGTAHGLLEWFLSQQGRCSCYTRAIWSGLPTTELAHIVRDVVIPRPELNGVYHVAGRAVSKYELLRMVADVYGKVIELVPDDRVVIDRSLDASRFAAATGYVAPAWPQLLAVMHADHARRPSVPA